VTNTPERLFSMVLRESVDYLGNPSPALIVAVVAGGVSIMAALVASCWLV
jgi:hypothetical protein